MDALDATFGAWLCAQIARGRVALAIDGKVLRGAWSGDESVTAAYLHTHVRGNWGIENEVHYTRDAAWREDANPTYTGNTNHALASFRNLAIGVIGLNGTRNIKKPSNMSPPTATEPSRYSLPPATDRTMSCLAEALREGPRRQRSPETAAFHRERIRRSS
ncbi:hypothetical protein [Frankia sp. EAN1pec]|uniref:hypothetical protein n=1 Tax=Parafrankia sp. (strain EAN1pec) TaxID=298653 RepID=UPI0018DD5DDC